MNDWPDPTCKHGKSVGRCYDCTMLLEDTRPDGSTRKADTGAGRATQAEPANNSSPVDTAGRSSFTHRIPFEDVQKMRAAVGRK